MSVITCGLRKPHCDVGDLRTLYIGYLSGIYILINVVRGTTELLNVNQVRLVLPL